MGLRILAIDTATEACSCAVWEDQQTLERFDVAPRQHTARLLPDIAAIMAEAGWTYTQLDAIAFGQGPGAFTGVRLALSVAQGIGLAADVPLVGISNLAAIAWAHSSPGDTAVVVMDARMQEVYLGAFIRRATGLDRLWEDQVLAPAALPDLPASQGACQLLGTGFGAYPDEILRRWAQAENARHALPSAAAIAVLAEIEVRQGRATDAAQAVPHYVRNQVASKPGR